MKLSAFLCLLVLSIVSVSAFAQSPEILPCKSIMDKDCNFSYPVITVRGITAEIKTHSEKEVRIAITEKTRETLADTDFSACPDNQCKCDENIKYLIFKGKAAAIDKINDDEMQDAKKYKCSLDDMFVRRRPDYVNATPTLISTAIYKVNYCRGCGGSCHGNKDITTYNTVTGQKYKIKDIVKNIPALEEAVIEGFMVQYAQPSVEISNQKEKEARLAEIKKFLKDDIANSPIADKGIYVEKDKVFISIGSFILSCAGGSFHPVEIPENLLNKDFLDLVKTKAE